MNDKDKSKKAAKPVDKLTVRAFGPFADAFGVELAKMPPFATKNLIRLSEKFQRKTKPTDNEIASARLFRQVVDEAAWADDEIVAEYLSGVLASSSKSIVSDRGVTIAALIRRLSALELRVHYLLYAALVSAGSPAAQYDLRFRNNMIQLHCEIELDELFESLGHPNAEWPDRKQILDHVVLGLAREDLINSQNWWYGEKQSYLEFHPTPLGAELFLWGLGSAIIDQGRLFDPGLELVLSEDIKTLKTVRLGNTDESINLADGEMYDHLTRRDLEALRAQAASFRNEYPERPNGYFYGAIYEALRDDPHSLDSMAKAAELAADELVTTGLTTLDYVAIQYPSHQASIMQIASALEQASTARRA